MLRDDAQGADVEDADFPPLEEEGGSRRLHVRQGDRGRRGDRGADNHAVQIRVMGGDLAGTEQVSDHVGVAKGFGPKDVGLGCTREVMNFHG